MAFLARPLRQFLPCILVCLACIGGAARGQENSVSIGISNLIIQGELNQVRSSVPFRLVAAPAYLFSITGNVHGVGPVFSALVPASEPVGTAFEAIHQGLSSSLQGSVANPGSQLPSNLLSQQVTSGTDGEFSAVFGLSLDASGEVTFSVTNVALVINGQPDTTDQLVFDSGSVIVTALFPDVSVATLSATNVTTNGAALQSDVVCPNPCQAYFIYGTGTSLNGTSSAVMVQPSATSQIVSIPITGLLPHQIYHFEAVAADITGPAYGEPGTFTTADVPPVAGAVSAFAGTRAMLIPVLANAINPAKDPLRITRVTNGIGGSARVAQGGAELTYQFTSGKVAADHFNYTISDTFGASSTSQVDVINYATLAGTYAAVLNNPGAQDGGSGFVRVSLAETGIFTGLVMYHGKAYSIHGAFDWTGSSSATVSASQLGGAGITLELARGANGYEMNAAMTVDAQVLTAIMPPAAGVLPGTSGLYTLLLPAPEGGAYVGTGYALMQVASNGLATVAGALPDGTAFSCQSVMDASGSLGVFSTLYAPGNPGSLAGNLTVSGSEQALLSGTLVWSKPALSNSAIDPGPFTIVLTGSGGRYTQPVHAAALQFGTFENSGQIICSGGNLSAPIDQNLMIEPNNTVMFLPQADKLALRIQPGTGLFTGSFVDPVNGLKRTFRGALWQAAGTGAGFFLGDSTSGNVELAR